MGKDSGQRVKGKRPMCIIGGTGDGAGTLYAAVGSSDCGPMAPGMDGYEPKSRSTFGIDS